MTAALVIVARHSHLYPGARVALAGGGPAAAGPCVVEFADGSAAPGEVAAAAPGRALLATAAYRTAAGTAIPAKRWLLARGEGDEWRVLGHAVAPRQ